MKIGLVILAACGLLLAGCGGSTINVSERISAAVGSEANCYDAGLEEVAGEREETYDCSFTYQHIVLHVCAAVADGDVYVVRHEAC